MLTVIVKSAPSYTFGETITDQMKRFVTFLFAITICLTSCIDNGPVTDTTEPAVEEKTLQEIEQIREATLGEILPDSIIPQSREVEEKLMRHKMQRAGGPDTVTLVVPVVWHVMYTTPTASNNISDAQINAAMQLMNEQAGAYGPEGAKVVPANVPFNCTMDGDLRSDCKIRFVLAKRDPLGRPSTGIDRVNASAIPGYMESGIRKTGSTVGATEDAVKGPYMWDNKKYLNMFVVSEISGNNGGSGVVGFAYFPSTGGSRVDAVVVQHSVVGYKKILPNSSTVENWQNTCIHEVGHWAGLYHTFQGTSVCGRETTTTCATMGDRNCDTPPTIQSSSCGVPTGCPGAPVGNYMGYSARVCQNHSTNGFTNGQCQRMRDQLQALRPLVYNNANLTAPTPLDASIEFPLPVSVCESSYSGLKATVRNMGSATITSVTVNGVDYVMNLAQNATAQITMNTIQMPSAGAYIATAVITKVNGQPDTFTNNNTASFTVNRINGETLTMSVTSDYFGDETAFELRDLNNALIWERNGYPINGSNRGCGLVTTDTKCVAKGQYVLTMKDTRSADAQTLSWACKGGFKMSQGAVVRAESKGCWCNPTATSGACQNCKTKDFSVTVE